jgi:hypothetical protein
MLPVRQVSEIIPELKMRLNRSTLNDKNTSEVDFMNSFLTISSPEALSFLYFFIHAKMVDVQKTFLSQHHHDQEGNLYF